MSSPHRLINTSMHGGRRDMGALWSVILHVLIWCSTKCGCGSAPCAEPWLSLLRTLLVSLPSKTWDLSPYFWSGTLDESLSIDISDPVFWSIQLIDDCDMLMRGFFAFFGFRVKYTLMDESICMKFNVSRLGCFAYTFNGSVMYPIHIRNFGQWVVQS